MPFDRRQVLIAALGVTFDPSVGAAGTDVEDTSVYPVVEEASRSTLTVRDDLGARLVLPADMNRVAVFNRYTAEFVRALAGSDVMVGVGSETARDHSYWPDLHAALIGQGQGSPNYEAIIALKPDAVFFPRNSDWSKARRVLEPFKIPVVVVTAWDVLKHQKNVSLLGALLDRRARAEELNAFYRRCSDILAERTAGIARKKVYFEEVAPYKTVLKGSGWHDMIETAGGINVFADVDGVKPPSGRGNNQAFDVDPEEIVARQPDMIVKLQPNQYAPHAQAFCTDILKSISRRPGFGTLSAVQTGAVYSMSYYLAGGCSKVIGALQIAKWLYPEKFQDVDPGNAMRIWLEMFQGVPYPGSYWMSLAQARQ